MYYITNILKNSEGKTNFFSKLYKQFTPPYLRRDAVLVYGSVV
jgi:hypothetical protein